MEEDLYNDLLPLLQKNRLPAHIAVIMDGNGRWAARQGKPRSMGHQAGLESMRRLIEICWEIEIPCLTVYAFSTENWKRSQEEVSFLMNLVVNRLRQEAEAMHKRNIRLGWIGRQDELSAPVWQAVQDSLALTAGNTGMRVNLALNYGGRDELVRAVRKLAAEQVAPEKINETMISSLLDTAGLPDPDLLIRPAGEERLSNFLLWQSAYSELWFSDKLWPDFGKRDLLQAVLDYQKRERRFGGVNPHK